MRSVPHYSNPSQKNEKSLFLDPKCKSATAKLISQMDPFTFFRFSMLCKGFWNLGFHSPKEEISVKCKVDYMNIREENGNDVFRIGGTRGCPIGDLSPLGMKKALTLPFGYNTVGRFYIEKKTAQDPELVSKIRSKLDALGVKKIHELMIDGCEGNWSDLVLLAKDYSVEKVKSVRGKIGAAEVKELLNMKLKEFSYYQPIDEDISEINIEYLSVKTMFDDEVLERIIDRWLLKEVTIGKWEILSSSIALDNLQSAFKRFSPKFRGWTPPKRLPETRPLAFFFEREDFPSEKYFILVRRDDLFLNIFIEDGKHVTMTTDTRFPHIPDVDDDFWDEEDYNQYCRNSRIYTR